MQRSIILFSTLILGACTLQNPSFVSDRPLQLSEQEVVFEREADAINSHDIDRLADDIKRRSDNAVTIHVLHQPTASHKQIAQAQANKLKHSLINKGVMNPIYIHLNNQGTTVPNQIQISYSALKAHTDCQHFITDADANAYTPTTDVPYQFGCSRDYYLSAMIARPSDLLGNTAASDNESQRLSKTLDTYRAGERITPASEDGISASDVYGE